MTTNLDEAAVERIVDVLYDHGHNGTDCQPTASTPDVARAILAALDGA